MLAGAAWVAGVLVGAACVDAVFTAALEACPPLVWLDCVDWVLVFSWFVWPFESEAAVVDED